MDLKAYSCGVIPENMICGLLPLRTQTARRISTSIHNEGPKRGGCLVVKASSGNGFEFGSGDPSIVDAGMIVLRKRMYELKLQENSYKSPEEWMEWEKKWHGTYHSHIFQAMEWLQFILINSRPSVTMALLSLICISVPASVILVLIACATSLSALLGHD